MALQLRSDELRRAERAEPLAPRVSEIPGAMNAMRKAFTQIIVHAHRSGRARTDISPPGTSARERAVRATISSVASAEGLDPDHLPAIRAWLRRWVQALGIPNALSDQQFHRCIATLAPSVRSGNRSVSDLMMAPAREQIDHLFDGLVYGQEVLHAAPAPQARPSTTAPAPSAGPVGRFLPPDESVGYEDRLRLMHEKGGSRALAARYTVEFLRLDPQILQPNTSIQPKGETDDSRKKKDSPGAPLAT